MPHGTPLCPPYWICLATAALQVRSSSVSSYVGITRSGMRYSNIEPLHERRIGSPPVAESRRPSAKQDSCGSSPCALAPRQPPQGGYPPDPGNVAEKRHLIEDDPALALEGLRPSARLSVVV